MNYILYESKKKRRIIMADIECIDTIKATTEKLEGIEALYTANAIDCLLGWKQNNGAEDLNKAKWYINRLLKEISTEEQKQEKAETCKERLKKEHPERTSVSAPRGCFCCPDQYGYAKIPDWCYCYPLTCIKCWDRPVENTEEKE